MKTKQQLQTELDDTLTMLTDAVKVRNWTIAGNAAGLCEALCAMLAPKPVTIGALHDSLNKLGEQLARTNGVFPGVEATEEYSAGVKLPADRKAIDV